MSETWTIGELAERAAEVLRPTARPGAAAPSPNGRVRDVPNERLIRWYTTIGLLDPPLARRGRVALYGRRHLAQLVAVKRRQAAGRSIAQIQAELAGATDATLESIARLPAPADPSPPALPSTRAVAVPAPTLTPAADDTPGRFWTRDGTTGRLPSPPGHVTAQPADRELPGPDDPTARAATTPPPATDHSTSAGTTRARRLPPRHTTTQPPHQEPPSHHPTTGAATTPPPATDHSAPAGTTRARHLPPRHTTTQPPHQEPPSHHPTTGAATTPPPASLETASGAVAVPGLVQGVRLAPTVTLLLDMSARPLRADDVAAIAAAARPLLDVLRERGIVDPAVAEGGSP